LDYCLSVTNVTTQSYHHLKQFPFNGKKLKPAKLRKDYWHPMASIEFPTGQGAVGRSVFQKLRELKHLHEVSWSDEIRYKRPDEYNSKEKASAKKASEQGRDFKIIRTKTERGVALTAQKPFSIADMAAVLSGQGAGNKMVTGKSGGETQLVGVTVRWANDEDKLNAPAWSSNVTHDLMDEPIYVSGKVEVPEVTVPVEAEPSEPAPKEVKEESKDSSKPATTSQ
jgi:hypothetical protein